MLKDVKIPEISESVESGDVTNVFVKEGDTISEDQGLLELETDKAVVEVPAPFGGTVQEVLVNKGDTVQIGQVVFKVETEAEDSAASEAPDDSEEAAPEEETAEEAKEKDSTPKDSPDSEEEIAGKADAEKEKEAVKRRPDGTTKPPAYESKADPKREGGPVPESSEDTQGPDIHNPPPASPSVRRFAREIGVNIREVVGTGHYGRITIDDVKVYAKRRLTEPQKAALPMQQQPLPDFEKWGHVTREKFNKVRQITAETMANAWATIPQVTQFEKADITDLEEFRNRFAKKVENEGGKLTVTAILIKVLALALESYPRFNASIDIENSEYIYKDYINIGIAAATPRGLLVPVMKNVQDKSITEVAIELADLAGKARDGKLSPDAMEGGTISLSNQGPMGGEQFTPIVYPPQVSILGVSTSRMEPYWTGSEFEPRTIMPLALSYDHRANDGADASAFLHFICESLKNPLALFL
ncbi:branched-chain alpha-keto acid dehydrogenase subunit E2 [bacterium]|nr:branched-chain alpha-keto acid dehydrogenase subunit E2 [bacterium]